MANAEQEEVASSTIETVKGRSDGLIFPAHNGKRAVDAAAGTEF
jgi:hypothetical protein